MAKTHYSEVARGNESTPHDEWSPTVCGMEYTESPVSNNWNDVNCKKCLSKKETVKYEQEHRYDNYHSGL